MTYIESRSRRPVGVEEFSSTGLPIKIGALDLNPPEKRQYILRMVVRAGGSYIIPVGLHWVRPMFDASLQMQQNMFIDHPFCYITVRHGIVDSQTDDEWHVDGFSTRVSHVPEQNYIWCSTVGTEYVPVEVEFPKNFNPLIHNVNHFLQKFVDGRRIENCEEKTLYCFDPYILHRRPPTTAGMMRTFVRISFVPIEINDINNTPNPGLPRIYTRDGVGHRNTLVDYML